ncbi:hypothetical protein NHX12_032603, partial [Muraenolepis orangiensis]
MALSQVKCLDENNVNPRTHEAKPEFLYCENQRLALEVLIRDGREAFRDFLKARELRGFLSDPEMDFLTGSAKPYDPGSDVLRSESDGEDLATLSEQYWPDLSDTSVPELDLGWPDTASYRGVTRTNVYAQPPLDGQAHIKEVVRKAIAQAQKMIAIAMDIFTDVDIFRDLLDAGHKRKVSVYILLERSTIPHFLSMCDRANMHRGHLKAVDSFDRLFRELYAISSAVDLQQVSMVMEPEPEPVSKPVAVAATSADVARKLHNPMYALLAYGTNPAPPSSSNTPKEMQGKAGMVSMKDKGKMAKMAEPPPIHPGLVDLEKAYLIPYLPTWPEPDPASDVIGFINVRDNNRQMQVHMQRSERFETSQAIRFSSPFSKPKETLPEAVNHVHDGLNSVKAKRDSLPEKPRHPHTLESCAPTAGRVSPCTPAPAWKNPNSRCHSRTPTPDMSDGYISSRDDSTLSTTSDEYYDCSESDSPRPSPLPKTSQHALQASSSSQ